MTETTTTYKSTITTQLEAQERLYAQLQTEHNHVQATVRKQAADLAEKDREIGNMTRRITKLEGQLADARSLSHPQTEQENILLQAENRSLHSLLEMVQGRLDVQNARLQADLAALREA